MRFKWVDGLLVAGLGMIAIGIGMNYRGQVKGTKVELTRGGVTGDIQRDSREQFETVPYKIMIDVGGEVIKPGVYELKKGDRVNDALVAAGGLAAGADREWVEKNINRAQIVSDGMKLFIPNKSQVTNNKLQTNSKLQITNVLGAGVINEKISINTAGVEELDKLSGIGPALANRIIDYRVENNGFRDINEIKLVSGIGDKLFEKIKDQISL